MTKGFIADLICAEAKKWVEVREKGFNSGKEVEMFQKAVDGKNNKEPWCMAFVQYCAKSVCEMLKTTNPLPQNLGEHCLSVWNQIPKEYRSSVGGRGMVAIWQHGTSSAGHTGFALDSGKLSFNTIEGNTNKAGSREGDGVYPKLRLMAGGSMKLKGFIDLPSMIHDKLPKEEKIEAVIIP